MTGGRRDEIQKPPTDTPPSLFATGEQVPIANGSRTEALELKAMLAVVEGRLTLQAHALFWTDGIEYSRKNFLGWTKDRCDVQFGFGGGELRVALVNATAPSEERYAPELAEYVELEVGGEAQDGGEAAGGIGFELGKEPKIKIDGSGKRNWSSKRDAHVRATSAVIAAGGPDHFPGWKFSSQDAALILWGRAPKKGVPLAQLVPSGRQVTATAGFIIHQRDIKCVSIDPVRPRDRARAAVIEKAFPQFLFRHWGETDKRKIGVAVSQVSIDTGANQGAVEKSGGGQ